MDLYYAVPFICGILLIAMGVFMYVKPELGVQKKRRGDEKELRRAKRNGIIISAVGGIEIIIQIVMMVITYK